MEIENLCAIAFHQPLSARNPVVHAAVIDLHPKALSCGGNLIMNVGPTGRGNFDHRAIARLDAYAGWMADHARAIYGCTAAPAEYVAPKGCLLTYNAALNRLYLHLVDYPAMLPLKIDFADMVRYAQLLNDASEIRLEGGGLCLPSTAPQTLIPVVELYLK